MTSHEEQLKKINANNGVWLIAEQEDIENMTVILVEIMFDQDIGNMGNEWRGVRLKCGQAWIMESNLSIANMDFEDFCNEITELDVSGMHWKEAAAFGISEDPNVKLEEALQKLRDEGHVY